MTGNRGSYGFNGSRQGFDGRGNFQRGGWSNNRGPGQSYVRPAERFPEPGRLGYSNRMSQEPGNGYTRPQMPARQAYGGSPQPYSRPAPQQSYGYRAQTDPGRREMYANPGYSNRPQTFNTEPGYGYGYAQQQPFSQSLHRSALRHSSRLRLCQPSLQSKRAPLRLFRILRAAFFRRLWQLRGPLRALRRFPSLRS